MFLNISFPKLDTPDKNPPFSTDFQALAASKAD